jgi:hypothetical protein
MRRVTKRGWQLSGTSWLPHLLFWLMVLRIASMFRRKLLTIFLSALPL